MKNKSAYIFLTSASLMGLYWFGNAFILTYASIFLLDKGLSNTQIGLVLSVGGVLSILFQGIPSALADRFHSVSLKLVMSLFLLMELILCTGIQAYSGNKLLLMAEYALLEGADWAFLAFINASSMEYENYGYAVNFSVVRSFGSVLYGVSTLMLGLLSSHFGLGFLIPCLILVRVVTLFNVLLMKNTRKSAAPKKTLSGSSAGPQSRTGTGCPSGHDATATGYLVFFRENPRLPFLLLGFFCLWMSGTSTNNYLIHIIRKVGGTNAAMGFISSTSAWMEVPFMLLCGFLLTRYSCASLLRISSFFYILKPTILLLASSIPIVTLGQYMQGPSYAIFTIASVYYMNHMVDIKDNAKAQALLGICTKGLSGIVANLVSGIMLDRLGINGMLGFCIGCTICGFSIIQIITRKN